MLCRLRRTVLGPATSSRRIGAQFIVAMSSSSSGVTVRDVAQEIQTILRSSLADVSHCEIVNESYMHSVPKGSQTHFKIFVVSPQFEKTLPITRHRTIFALTKPFMRPADADPSSPTFFHQIHALSIVAKTPEEWEREKDTVEKRSPACLGQTAQSLTICSKIAQSC